MRDRRARLKGRTTSGRFAALPRELVQHQAVTSLDFAARWMMVAFASEYNGRNNGAIAMTRATAALYGFKSTETIQRSIAALTGNRLVLLTDPGSYIPPRPARYAITWKPIDQTAFTTASPVASHDYRRLSDAA